MFSKAFAALVAALSVSFQKGGMVAAQQGGTGLDMEGFNSLTNLAEEEGLLASDANGVVIGDKMELGLGHINLTDEEILAANPALVSFLDILEDDDKFAKWEREKVPGLLLEIQASSKKSNKAQKKWARKAVAASEMSACSRKNYWKEAAYSACRRWGSNWWDSWICQRWGCHGDDNHVLGLCHRSCKGWSDDGTRCWKKCGSITTTPTTCGNAYCAEDSSACASHVFNIVFSIAQMLSNLIPQKALVTLGGRVAKGVSKAVLKAALKEFAKAIVKNLVKKTKRKVKKFINTEVKGQVKYLKDELVEEIISEAAEAFAIERARKQVNKRDFPEIEEVAAAIDPIGVTDVIEAFNKPSCDQTELGAFPSCPTGFASWSYGSVVLQAEEGCCYGYGAPTSSWFFFWNLWEVTCYASPSQQASVGSAQDATTDDGSAGWVYTDDDLDIDPSSEVDSITQDLPVPFEDVILCQQCALHAACNDNEVEGANLTVFDMCTAKGCCGPAPEGYEVPDDDGGATADDIMLPMEKLIADVQDSNFLSASQEDFCDTCASFGLCLSPTSFAICNDKGCCDGLEDPEDPEWIPPPINTSNETESNPTFPTN